MSIWERYEEEQRKEYIKFLQVYGALTHLFSQKNSNNVPYLDSKFQETIYARVFNSKNVDIGNTPHDILSEFGTERIGIGLKTWMNSKDSYQKVMQLKAQRANIDHCRDSEGIEATVYLLSNLKNERLRSDYARLGLGEDANIYHYVTRDEDRMVIQECSYVPVDIDRITDIQSTDTNISWSDGIKKYKYTFADSQIYQHFSTKYSDTTIQSEVDIKILADPFSFLLDMHAGIPTLGEGINVFDTPSPDENIVEAYLPLYSYKDKEVQLKSALNAWNAAPKNKNSDKLRPLNEVYIPIPKEFHYKCPDFFTSNIFSFMDARDKADTDHKPQLRFHIELPNGKRIPALLTQSGMKALQSGSDTEINPETGKYYGQAELGQWLLVDVLGLRSREVVTKKWLEERGTDSVRLWRQRGDYSTFYIDFAPYGSFEKFMDPELEISEL